MKMKIALIGVTALLVTASYGGTIVPLSGDTNALGVLTTNTYALPNDSLVNSNGLALAGNLIPVTTSSTLWLSAGGLFYNSTNAVQNYTVRLSGSVDGSTWTNSAATVVITVPALVTNYYYAFQNVSTPMPFYAVRTLENTNNWSAASTNTAAAALQVKAFTRTGI